MSTLTLPAALRHVTRIPPQNGISTEAVCLYFRDAAGRVGHLADDNGPMEMVGIATRGGQPLAELAKKTLSILQPGLQDSFNVIGAHQQNLSPSGRITYVLLNMPEDAQKRGLTFAPLENQAEPPTGPGFVAEGKRGGLRDMALSAIRVGIAASSVQLKSDDIVCHIPHQTVVVPRPLTVPEQRAAEKAANAAASSPTNDQSNLLLRIFRTGRDRVGPGSNPA